MIGVVCHQGAIICNCDGSYKDIEILDGFSLSFKIGLDFAKQAGRFYGIRKYGEVSAWCREARSKRMLRPLS